jgi:hypothetical protein
MTALGGAADVTAAEPTGYFQGAVTSKQAGKLVVSLNLRCVKGKYEGELVTPVGTLPVQSGAFEADRLRLHFSTGGDAGTVEARLDGETLRGSFRVPGDAGSLELKRVGDARPRGWDRPTLNLTRDKWREDLRFFAAELPKRHANAFHHISRKQFDAEVADLDRGIDSLDNDAIFVGLVRIASAIGDAHTQVLAPENDGNFPIDVKRFGDDYRVVAVSPGHEAALGAQVVKVQDTPVARVSQLLLALTPQDENPTLGPARVEWMVTTGLYLHGLGITVARDQARYVLADGVGREFAIDMRAVTRDEARRIKWVWAFKEEPLSRQGRGDGMWYTYLEGPRTVYCNFRRYDDLARNAQGLLKLVGQKRPDKLVIDLRQNGGGDYTQGEQHLIEPIRRLADINRRGHFFVLIGPSTFSAAMCNASQFRSRTAAILVGEPIGEKPNSYQESRQMTLPNSRLIVRYSTQYYKFADDHDNEIRPDHDIVCSWDDYKAGRDPVLKWALQYKR